MVIRDEEISWRIDGEDCQFDEEDTPGEGDEQGETEGEGTEAWDSETSDQLFIECRDLGRSKDYPPIDPAGLPILDGFSLQEPGSGGDTIGAYPRGVDRLIQAGLEEDDADSAENPEYVSLTELEPVDYPVWGFDIAPRKFSLKDSSVHIEDDFSRIIRGTADFPLPKWLEELSKTIKSVDVQSTDGSVIIKAQGEQKIDFGGLIGEVRMKDPSFRIKFDPGDSTKVEIVDISGAETKLGRLKSISLQLVKNGEGKPVIRTAFTHEAPPKPEKPKDGGFNIGLGDLKDAAGGLARLVANNVSIDIPLEMPEQRAKDIFEYASRWSKLKTFSDVADLLGDASEIPVLKDAIKDITSVTRSGDNGEKLEITRKGVATLDLGALGLKLDEKIQMKLSQEGTDQGQDKTSIKISDISGISARLPLPKEVLDKLGIAAEVKLSEISLSAKQPDGTRRLTMKTKDHGSVSIDLGRDGLPVMKDGQLTVDVKAMVQGAEVPFSIKFDPAKAAKAGPEGPDFTITFKGTDEGLSEVLKKVVGGDLGPVDQLARGLKEIRKEGNKITVSRERATSAEMGSLVVEAGREVSFKVDQKNGVTLSDISGLSYKFKLDLGALNNALDLPKETASTKVTSFSMSNPDRNGQQKIIVRGDGPVAAAAFHVKNGKIATDPADDNRGSIYTMIRQARTDADAGKPQAYIPVIIKVGENGEPKMTNGEIAKAAAEAVYAVMNKDKFRGFEPIMVNGKEMFTAASSQADSAPEAYIPGYDLKVRMQLPSYRGGKGVVLYHDGGRLKAVTPEGDEWELRQVSGYKQSRDKYDLDKTFWVKTDGPDLRWPASGDANNARVITIPGYGIDVRMHLPGFDGEHVYIQANQNGVIRAVSGGKIWNLCQRDGYNQQRDSKNPNMTYWKRVQ